MYKVIERTKELLNYDNDLNGWVMSDVLKTIAEEFDADAADVARTYIVKEHCGIVDEGDYR